MMRTLVALITLCFFAFTLAGAAEPKNSQQGPAKTLSGMAIVGNDEAPKALYLVPWQSSELGKGVTIDMPGDRDFGPVNREEFGRKVNYYYISTNK